MIRTTLLLTLLLASVTQAQGLDVPGFHEVSIQEIGPPAPTSTPGSQGSAAFAGPTPVAPVADLVLVIDGQTHLVHLQLHDLRSARFQLIEVRDGRPRIVDEVPAPRTYRGQLVELDGTPVEGAVVAASQDLQGRWSAAILLPDDAVFVQPLSTFLPASDPRLHVVYRQRDVVAPDRPWRCAPDEPRPANPEMPADPTLDSRVTGRKLAELAFDTDVEFWQANGSSVPNSLLDLERILSVTEAVYERDTAITYELTTAVIRTGDPALDPYESDDAQTVLACEFRPEWTSNLSAVDRDAVQLHLGKSLGGVTIGIASPGGMCSRALGVSVVTSFASPVLSDRAALSAHELGHNWNADHCDGVSPCHIMCSAIRLCDGIGLPNFGTLSIAAITAFRDTLTCLDDEQDPLQLPFFDDVPQGPLSDVWSYVDQVSGSRAGDGEPTPDRALRLNSTGTGVAQQDDIRSNFIDLSSALPGTLALSYFAQRKGAESGEALVIEYRDQIDLAWIELDRLTSDGVDQAGFEFHRVALPDDALHARFRLRLRVEADERDDDWFVDNIRISDGPNLSQTNLVAGTRITQSAHGLEPNTLVAFASSLTGTGGPTPFGSSMTDLLPPFLLPICLHSDADGVATREFYLPRATVGMTVHTQAMPLTLLPTSPSNVVSQSVE